VEDKNIIDPVKLAIDFTCFTNRSLFVTGKAGSGKTTFLKSVREICRKKLLVLAPTGIAAINVDGLTIHSFFQFPFEILNDDFFKKSFPRYNQSKKEIIEQLELLIIDEISMVRPDVIDGIDRILRFYRDKQTIPFGGVQLLLIGDLFQLSPVLKEKDIAKINEVYPSPFFFDAVAIKKLDYVTIEFTSIFRQRDNRFIALLNKVRNNLCSDEDLKLLNGRYIPNVDLADEYIFLTTHKLIAEEINKKALGKITAPLVSINAIIEGEFPESLDPTPRRLEVKEGARVIFTKNDASEKKEYYNGKAGTIVQIGQDQIRVRISENELVELDRSTWINRGAKYEPSSGKIESTELGTFRQFPIKLAWAITIHKSQGMTFEKAVIDARDSFAPGQVYVALSRLRTLDGLVLQTQITNGAIQTDPRIIAYNQSGGITSDLEKELKSSKLVYRHQLLKTLLSFERLNRAIQKFCSAYKDTLFASSCHAIADELITVSSKFLSQLDSLLSLAHNDHYEMVQTRTAQAADYFTRIIQEKLIRPLEEYSITIKETKKNEPFIAELNLLFNLFAAKKREMEAAVTVVKELIAATETDELVQIINKRCEIAQELVLEIKKTEQKSKKTTTQTTTLSFFQKGLTIDQIAQKRKLSRGIIEEHLNSFIKSGEISLNQLVTEEKVRMISALRNENPVWSVHEMRLALGSEFSFGEIRAVLETL